METPPHRKGKRKKEEELKVGITQENGNVKIDIVTLMIQLNHDSCSIFGVV